LSAQKFDEDWRGLHNPTNHIACIYFSALCCDNLSADTFVGRNNNSSHVSDHVGYPETFSSYSWSPARAKRPSDKGRWMNNVSFVLSLLSFVSPDIQCIVLLAVYIPVCW
jgi:hypothetical protein